MKAKAHTQWWGNLDGGEKKSITYKYIFFWGGGAQFFNFNIFSYFLFFDAIIDFN